jgi:hypothetical protein
MHVTQLIAGAFFWFWVAVHQPFAVLEQALDKGLTLHHVSLIAMSNQNGRGEDVE